ncbi:MAG: murein DD-endopeptidase MepM/ murein hydrolase activator NlpD [Sphingobacteriales bacterium]|jgi:murein DD-endopeptidase MepM/ murein hydrolase activator NlpD
MPHKKRTFLERWRVKFKLVILNDDTFEEKASFRLSRLNVSLFIALFLVVFSSIGIFLILNTPVKEYILGYSDVYMRRELTYLTFKVDSLESVAEVRREYIQNIKRVLEGDLNFNPQTDSAQNASGDQAVLAKGISTAEEKFRKDIEEESKLLVMPIVATSTVNESILMLFTPVKGIISDKFNVQTRHFGVDIVCEANESVKSILDGTVVLATYTPETGNVIGVIHEPNILSLYKHNAVLLKKVGNFVRAGEVLAIVGDSGEMSSGPHLHFELWIKGSPVNPEDHINF